MSLSYKSMAIEMGDRLINISELLAPRLLTWSNMETYPSNLGETEIAGYTNKLAAENDVQLIIDVLAPKKAEVGTLRLWGIIIVKNEDKTNIFYNIQLDFSVEKDTAHILTAEKASISRDRFRELLHSDAIRLEKITVSNGTGRDKKTKALLGERRVVDLSTKEDYSKVINRVYGALKAVMTKLEAAAQLEAKNL